ncbi:MAG: TatA/E family twin arginine-targeting protein translocase [Leptolyngbya sp. SIO1E4]|nr:TatA/E family twin arginine-targeting protein translocase [Leptolyngbya sp. SIO1E4]
MNIFGVGLPEMALILVLALLVFGPKKLPEIGRSLAQALGSFKKAQQEFETEFKKEAEQIQKSITEPMKASIERPEPKALSPRQEADAPQEEGVVTAETVVEEPKAETSQTEAPPSSEDTQAA